MDPIDRKAKSLRLDLLPENTRKALEVLKDAGWLESDGWYLAGGTALALQQGHRKSVDLDFFCPARDFPLPSVTEPLKNFSWKPTILQKGTVYGELEGAKVSFIAYPYFIPSKEKLSYGKINILSEQDIAVMKIVAISQRGAKRDFYDLYFCALNLAPLETLIPKLKDQYPDVAQNYHHILKSLAYFDDAEAEPEPDLLFEANWNKVKMFFRAEVKRLAPTVLQLG